MRSAVRGQRKSCAAPEAELREASRCPSSAIHWRSRVAIPSTLSGSTRWEYPPAISFSDEVSEVITATPEAIASTTGSPNPS